MDFHGTRLQPGGAVAIEAVTANETGPGDYPRPGLLKAECLGDILEAAVEQSFRVGLVDGGTGSDDLRN
jgi:hypothetical protein